MMRRFLLCVIFLAGCVARPARGVQTYMGEGGFIKSTEASEELTDLETTIVVASVLEYWFGLTNLVAFNQTPEYVQVTAIMRESLGAVPDETYQFTIAPSSTQTLQIPKQYVGATLGLGAHVFKVLVDQSSSGPVIYQPTTYLGLWNNTGGGPGGGTIVELNGQTGASQTLVTGTAGADFNIVSATNIHTFNLPDAAVAARGAVTTAAQEFNGVKTFDDGIVPECGAAETECTEIGLGASNVADYSVCVGGQAWCIGTRATGIGAHAQAATDGTAVGYGAIANANTTAIGSGAVGVTANTFVAGSAAQPMTEVFFGEGETDATPLTATLHGTAGVGADVIGADLRLGGGLGTGSGIAGDLLFSTGVAIGSGSSAQTLYDRWAVRGTTANAGSLEPVTTLLYDLGGPANLIGTGWANTWRAGSYQGFAGSAGPGSLVILSGGAADGTDQLGGDTYVSGGRSTGNAAPGQILFQTTTAGGSGTALQAVATRWRIDSTGDLLPETTNSVDVGAYTQQVKQSFVRFSHDGAEVGAIADNGGGTPATGTHTPSTSYVTFTCSDGDGCELTLGEAGMLDGARVEYVNVSSNALVIKQSAGVTQLPAGADVTLGQWDILGLRYVTDRWVARYVSDN